MSPINSLIFGDSDCTLAVRTLSRLLGCIRLPVFVGGGFPGGGDWGTCGVWSAVGCCCPWQSLSFLLVTIVGTVGDHPCWLFSFLLVVIDFVACEHPWILWIIIDSSLFCPKHISSPSMNHLLLLWCPINAVGSLFFRINKKIDHLCSVRWSFWW